MTRCAPGSGGGVAPPMWRSYIYDEGARRVLDRYMAAFVQSDMAALERLLAEDAALHPFAIVVLATTATHLKRISLFTDPALFTLFDLTKAQDFR